MDNDEKEWRKPPAWKVDDVREEIRDKVGRDVNDRINVGIRSRGCRNRGWGGLIPGAIIPRSASFFCWIAWATFAPGTFCNSGR